MRYTDRHKARGRDYDETFSPTVNPYRAMTWRLEQRALNEIVRRHPDYGEIALLDFACGTGRILAHLYGQVGSITGIDVSPSMLEVARQVAPGAELIEADLTERDVLGERYFDLITAFRFFPNAEPELRRTIFRVLARHLAPRGLLVFNNHKNLGSLRGRFVRLSKREVGRGTMTPAEVEALVADAGLRILQVIPFGTVPASDKHLPLPVALLEPLERWLSRVTMLAPIAQNIVYVCARAA